MCVCVCLQLHHDDNDDVEDDDDVSSSASDDGDDDELMIFIDKFLVFSWLFFFDKVSSFVFGADQ
jgi:hypothetical protein